MINGFHAAKSGLNSFQYSLDVTANNIANANTDGYQSKTVNFADLIYTGTQGTALPAGNGSRPVSTSVNLTDGVYRDGSELSGIINGDGYYAVTNPNEGADADVLYMRAGNFSLTPEGEALYLTAQGGEYVLDQAGQRIEIVNDDLAGAFAQIAVYDFGNPRALTALGDSRFLPNESSGEATLSAIENVIQQGVTEGSNVDMAVEMAHLMNAQRGFQLNARMLQTADEIEQTANSLRG